VEGEGWRGEAGEKIGVPDGVFFNDSSLPDSVLSFVTMDGRRMSACRDLTTTHPAMEADPLFSLKTGSTVWFPDSPSPSSPVRVSCLLPGNGLGVVGLVTGRGDPPSPCLSGSTSDRNLIADVFSLVNESFNLRRNRN
jgi:hypothetical protein